MATHDHAESIAGVNEAISEITAAQAAAKGHLTNAMAELTAAADDIAHLDAAVATLNVVVDDLEAYVPEVPAPPAVYPKIASVQQNTGESWDAAVLRHLTYGYNGAVLYIPPGKPTAWNAALDNLAAKVPDLQLQLTVKDYDEPGLKAFIAKLPSGWKRPFRFNRYQEPEDNMSTQAQFDDYKSSYVKSAPILRAAGLQAGWLEFQEWTLDPANTKGWNLANFIPPADSFDGILWSLFEYGEKDRLDAQIARIQAAMVKYAPGKPWALMASAYTLEPPPGTNTQKAAQAKWLQDCLAKTKGAGSQGFAWFNYNWPGTGGASGEGRIELNPAAMAALKAG